MRIIDTNRLNVEKIVSELYDFSKLGAISIPGVLSERSRAGLLHDIGEIRHYFNKSPEMEGEVLQDMYVAYYEDFGQHADLYFGRNFKQLIEEWRNRYRNVADIAGFGSGEFNSIGVHNYPSGSKGIAPHRDYARDRDLISIFVLAGRAPFYICKDKSGKDKMELDSSPGSLILMRAARNESEHQYRPIHCVGDVEEDRYTVIFRRRENSVNAGTG